MDRLLEEDQAGEKCLDERREDSHAGQSVRVSPETETTSSKATLVSAIIPTRNRVMLLKRALESVLNQSYSAVEIIVVIDGPDAETEAYLRSIHDPRLRYVALAESAGGSEVRNIGVRAATGKWVAFLDDDDTWMPTKIEKQIALAQTLGGLNTVIACKVIGRYPQQDYIWPTRFPADGEPICEYLFNRRSWFRGEGQIQTSMLFVSRELMLKIPFTTGLRKHQDTDWYVRAGADQSVEFLFVDEPLVVWYLGEARDSIVRHYDWERSWKWLLSVRNLISRRSFAGFIAGQIAGEAAGQKRMFQAAPFLLRKMVTLGQPGFMEIALFVGNSVLSASMRGRLRRKFSRNRSQSGAHLSGANG